jgi:hypothetical protein
MKPGEGLLGDVMFQGLACPRKAVGMAPNAV